jgi:hypothetical protein
MTFKYFLDFISLPEVGRIEISEPFGFDGATHSVEQDNGRFGRDMILASEEIDLEFTSEHFEKLATAQFLPDGTPFDYASHGYQWLIDVMKNEGWEGEVEFIIQKNGVDFITGQFDFFTANVGYNSIKFKIIQNTLRELVKRREDVFVDAFSNKDLDGNPIRPVDPIDILLKAKPIQQFSEWGEKSEPSFSNNGNAFLALTAIPLTGVITTFGVENTYSPFFSKVHIADYNTTVFNQYLDDTKIITAETRLTNLNIKIKNLSFSGSSNTIIGDFCNIILRRFVVGSPVIETQSFSIPITANTFSVSNQDYEFNMPFVESGESLQLVLQFNFSTSGLQSYNIEFNSFSCDGVTASVTSTSIDSVVKGIRLIDLLKHNVNSIANIDLIAPMYDVGGEHYDTFAFNGYLLGQITDKPFNNKFKDLMNVPTELNADYQINTDNVEILPYESYYTNNEIGAFLQIANSENTQNFNKDYFIKTIEYNYKNTSTGRQVKTENTIDDVHGKTQWLYPSKKTDGNFKREIDHVRSAFIIEEQRRKAIEVNETTSLENDTKLFLIDCTSLAPNTKRTITDVFTQQWASPTLKILSNNFNWTLLGFGVGSFVKITRNGIEYSYTVVAIEPSVITLSGGGVGNQVSGTFPMSIEYTITNVFYTNRTNEGFTLIEGVENSTNYSNLLYSIKRNLNRFKSYFSTAGVYLSGEISNTLFENNGNLVTQFVGETQTVIDKAPIPIDGDSKILNPIIHNITVFAEFDEATQLFEDIQSEKGFIRVQTLDNRVIKGYPKKAEYLWKEGELDLTLEERFESDFLTIVSVGSDIFVNDIGYAQKIGLNWYNINNSFVSLYDSNNILLATPTRFTNVKINGVSYTDKIEFADALNNLLPL